MVADGEDKGVERAGSTPGGPLLAWASRVRSFLEVVSAASGEPATGVLPSVYGVSGSSPMGNEKRIEWVLRLAVAAEFLGHGYFALSGNPAWIPFVTLFGFSSESAGIVMPVVGALDVALAALVLVRPVRAALLWMTFWGLFTALLRPATGLSVFDFVERGANWGAPLALLLLRGLPRRPRDLFR